jgi:hypothetical protein
MPGLEAQMNLPLRLPDKFGRFPARHLREIRVALGTPIGPPHGSLRPRAVAMVLVEEVGYGTRQCLASPFGDAAENGPVLGLQAQVDLLGPATGAIDNFTEVGFDGFVGVASGRHVLDSVHMILQSRPDNLEDDEAVVVGVEFVLNGEGGLFDRAEHRDLR